MARLKRQKFLSILKERETEREGGAGREGERGRGRKGGREGEGGREKERERGGGEREKELLQSAIEATWKEVVDLCFQLIRTAILESLKIFISLSIILFRSTCNVS